MSKRSLKEKAALRIGTADIVSGTLARASQILNRGRSGRPDDRAYINERDICNILHDLQMGAYADVLHHLDFDRVAGNSWSRVLEHILFQSAAWCFHETPNPVPGDIYIDPDRAEAYLTGLADDYPENWPAVRAKIEEVAWAFVEALHQKRRRS